jgi:hypothetical protein
MAERGKIIYVFVDAKDKMRFDLKRAQEGRKAGETIYLLLQGYLSGKFKLTEGKSNVQKIQKGAKKNVKA